jgi:translation initiation factor IF-3
VTVRFRGRELTHPELGRNLIAKFTDQVKDHGIAERTPVLEGKSMFITMASTHKPKGQDLPARPGRPAEGEPAEAAAPEAPAPVGAANGAANGAVPASEPPEPVAVAAEAPVAKKSPAASPAPEPATTGE